MTPTISSLLGLGNIASGLLSSQGARPGNSGANNRATVPTLRGWIWVSKDTQGGTRADLLAEQ